MQADTPDTQPDDLWRGDTTMGRAVATDMERVFAGFRPAEPVAPAADTSGETDTVAAVPPPPRRGGRLGMAIGLGAMAVVGATLATGYSYRDSLPQIARPAPPAPAPVPAPRPAAPPAEPPRVKLVQPEASAPPPAEPVPAETPAPVAKPPSPKRATAPTKAARDDGPRVLYRPASSSDCTTLDRWERAWCMHPEILAADRRLRAAYDAAARAGVPADKLRRDRREWERLRRLSSNDPARLVAGYDALAEELRWFARQ